MGGMPDYEAVIGLEVHARLTTRSKIFCGCPTTYGAEPNALTCPVCLGHPGALPVLNQGAVELAVLGALALGCTVHAHSVFARKNYFYPDLPKGYQISQYDEPLATGGEIAIEIGGERRRISLVRLHLEEDAGKSIHDGMPDSDRSTYVDLNRAGVPLVEIVSRPEIRSPEEAYLCLQRLRSILRYVGVCEGNLEEGSMRCDANVSIRPRGSTSLGNRTELKNLNSFRNVQRALSYEIARQAAVVRSGGTVAQETVLWDAAAGKTRPMRGKEEVQDYRYFPEPDLPPLEIGAALVDGLRARLPELPAERKQRLLSDYGVDERAAHLLTLERPLADYFEEVARRSSDPRMAANFVLNDLLRAQNRDKRDAADIPVPAAHLAELIRMVHAGKLSVSAARALFAEMFLGGRAPSELVAARHLEQLSDAAALEELVRRVLDEHPAKVEEYRRGKKGLLGFFVGRVMKASGGRANPRIVDALLKEWLG
jgi:aspartyl-tRNA(Asn)/glutamyl-tRNA(Gln) amidotransferase subunit B